MNHDTNFGAKKGIYKVSEVKKMLNQMETISYIEKRISCSYRQILEIYIMSFCVSWKFSVFGRTRFLNHNDKISVLLWQHITRNALSHLTLFVLQFCVKNNITVAKHPFQLPDLAPINFFLFSKLKFVLTAMVEG